MICLNCPAVIDDPVQRFCITCGQRLAETSGASIERFAARKLDLQLAQWRMLGLVDGVTADKLCESLVVAPVAAAAVVAPTTSVPAPRLTQPEGGRRRRNKPPAPHVPVHPRPSPAAKPEADTLPLGNDVPPAAPPPDTHDAAPAGVAMMESVQGATAPVGAIDAFTALDEKPTPHGSRGFSIASEYVWWFIGALLVLGGSVMGVREAWLALGGTSRQLLVASALFAYHAGFVGMAALVARRSGTAGRVLSAIALGLLPVVFVALASLTQLSPVLGLGAAAALSAGLFFTLGITARRFESASVLTLAMALGPSLLGILVLGPAPESSWVRLLLPLVGAGALAFSSWTHLSGEKLEHPAGASLGAALFGALSLTLVTALDTPVGGTLNPDLLDFGPGSVRLAGLLLGLTVLAALVAYAASRPAMRQALPESAHVVEVLAITVVAGLSLGTALPLMSGAVVPGGPVALASLATVGLGALLLSRLQDTRPAVLHVALVLGAMTTALVAGMTNPQNMAWWAFGAGVMAPVANALGAQAEGRARRIFTGWGITLGVSMVLLATVLDSGQPFTRLGSLPASVATALMIGLASHLGTGRRVHGAHTYGGAAVLYAAFAWALLQPRFDAVQFTGLLAGLALAYRVLGVLLTRFGTGDESVVKALRPLDDVALPTGVVALVTWALLAPAGAGWSASWPVALAAVVTFAGAYRDRSVLVAIVGVVGLDLALLSGLGTSTAGRQALVHGGAALAAAWLAWLSRAAEDERQRHGRALLGFLQLPFGASGRTLTADALAWGAAVLTVEGAVSLWWWLSNRLEAERGFGIEAAALMALAWATAFGVRTFGTNPRIKGHAFPLYLVGLFAALGAVVNRVGRPLPPHIVGRNLSLGLLALWGLSLVLQRYGPALSEKLDNPGAGKWYRDVPLVGTLALSVVLVIDALFLSAPFTTAGLVYAPALFFFGPAVGLILLSREWKYQPLLDGGLALLIPGLGVALAQRTPLGPELVPLPAALGTFVRAGSETLCAAMGPFTAACALADPTTEPLRWNDAASGVAFAALLFPLLAVLLRKQLAGALKLEHPETSLATWAAAAGALTAGFAFALSNLPAAAMVLAGGVVLQLRPPQVNGKASPLPAWLIAVGGGLVVHAYASAQPLVPLWAGPALALLAVVPSLPALTGKTSLAEQPHRLTVLSFLGLAVVYALAAGTATVPVWVGAQLLSAGTDALNQLTLLAFPAMPATLVLAAFALAFASAQKDDEAAAVLGWFVAPVASLGGALQLWRDLGGDWNRLQASPGELVSARGALAAAVAAGLTHLGVQAMQAARFKHARNGLRFGRDTVLAGLGLWVGLFAAYAGRVEGQRLFETCVAAIGVAVLTSVHATWTEKTARHVYLVESAVVGVYAVARSQVLVPLPRELDALLVLGLGFFLVGVTVLARRNGTPPVANATRRFTAVLPVLVAFVTPGGISNQSALAALGSSFLYGALATVEGSKLLGSLAAAAANVALLLWALSSGLTGAEVYLAPAGLLLMALGHLFNHELPHGSRQMLRVTGGLLFYVPAGVRVSLELAQGTNGLYPVAFGALCLLGVAVGVGLRIRAYLAFGTFFLTLDVLANLVFASLRDHRIGFVVLSVAGLAILGTMIGVTLKREEVERALGKAKARWKSWD